MKAINGENEMNKIVRTPTRRKCPMKPLLTTIFITLTATASSADGPGPAYIEPPVLAPRGVRVCTSETWGTGCAEDKPWRRPQEPRIDEDPAPVTPPPGDTPGEDIIYPDADPDPKGNGRGNNGWGNGDQDAPGNSADNNNAENSGGTGDAPGKSGH